MEVGLAGDPQAWILPSLGGVRERSGLGEQVESCIGVLGYSKPFIGDAGRLGKYSKVGLQETGIYSSNWPSFQLPRDESISVVVTVRCK